MLLDFEYAGAGVVDLRSGVGVLLGAVAWLAAIVLVVVGAAKRWLTAYEVSLSSKRVPPTYDVSCHIFRQKSVGVLSLKSW